MDWILLHVLTSQIWQATWHILFGTARSEKGMEPPSDGALSPSCRRSLAVRATSSKSHDYFSATSFNPVGSFQSSFKSTGTIVAIKSGPSDNSWFLFHILHVAKLDVRGWETWKDGQRVADLDLLCPAPFFIWLFLPWGIGNILRSKIAAFLWKRCHGQAARCISLMGDPQEVRLRLSACSATLSDFPYYDGALTIEKSHTID